MSISVVIVAFNEEENLVRTLPSVTLLLESVAGEIVLVDSGSTDRTCEVAAGFGACVFVEKWRGFAAQKNQALDRANCDWILSLDADEELSPELRHEIVRVLQSPSALSAYLIARRNFFLGRWIRRGGFYPDRKLRLFRRGAARFENRAVHEDARLLHPSPIGQLRGDMLHHSYPRLSSYIEHMNRYSSLSAQMLLEKNQYPGSLPAFLINVFFRPLLTFLYNYLIRLGFLDGREGLLLHLYHAGYVSWKYAKAWEFSHNPPAPAAQ